MSLCRWWRKLWAMVAWVPRLQLTRAPLPVTTAADISVEKPKLSGRDRAMLAPRRARRLAVQRVAKLRKRLEAAVARGDKKTVSHLQRVLLNADSVKLAATAEAIRKQRRRLPGKVTARDVVEAAFSLDMHRAPDEDVRLYPKRKSDTEFRPIHVFGVRNHARQVVFNWALEPRTRLDKTRQFAWCGGRPAAARAVLQHIDQGARWACSLDIKSFFPSISREWVITHLPMPGEVTRETAIPSEDHIRPEGCGLSRAYWRPLSDLSLRIAAGRGMPQGSACSPLIAEFVVSQILSVLPPEVRVVNYADNFLLLANTREELEQAVQDLGGAVTHHPAGPFTLTRGPIRRVAQGAEFLGYRFESYRGRASAQPTSDALRECASELMGRMRDVVRGRPRAVGRFRSFCRGWAAAFSMWSRAVENIRGALFWGAVRLGRAAVDRLRDIMSTVP